MTKKNNRFIRSAFLFLFVFVLSQFAMAQGGVKEKKKEHIQKKEKIHKERLEKIAEELNLSEEQKGKLYQLQERRIGKIAVAKKSMFRAKLKHSIVRAKMKGKIASAKVKHLYQKAKFRKKMKSKVWQGIRQGKRDIRDI